MFTKGIRPEKQSIKPGEKFGKLTVISYTDRPNKKGEYKCKCECGNITYARTSALKKGFHTSCKCSQKEGRPHKRLPDNLAIKKALFKNYKSSALKRDYSFELTLDEFVKLIEGDCIYCNSSPKTSSNIGHITNYYHYKYNGIDRVDNNNGYTCSNTVSCCPHCNMAKRQLPIEDFKSWIKKVYYNLFQKPSTTIPKGSTLKQVEMENTLYKGDDIV